MSGTEWIFSFLQSVICGYKGTCWVTVFWQLEGWSDIKLIVSNLCWFLKAVIWCDVEWKIKNRTWNIQSWVVQLKIVKASCGRFNFDVFIHVKILLLYEKCQCFKLNWSTRFDSYLSLIQKFYSLGWEGRYHSREAFTSVSLPSQYMSASSLLLQKGVSCLFFEFWP